MRGEPQDAVRVRAKARAGTSPDYTPASGNIPRRDWGMVSNRELRSIRLVSDGMMAACLSVQWVSSLGA